VSQGKFDLYRSPHGAGHQRCPLDVEGVQEPAEILDDREWPRRWVGSSERALVVCHDHMLRGERFHLMDPHAMVGDAGVKEDHGRAVPGDLVVQPATRNLGEPGSQPARHAPGR
jgi:hypothetical protein